MTTGTSEARLFASLAANNATAFYADLVAYLARALDRPMRLDDEPAWQIREQRLIRGQAQLGLVCGLQYVRSRERGDEPGMELLAAPVMLGGRYGLEPVYFSDVVVRVGHAARTFDDLSGTCFAFNERTSHSGYGVVRHALAERGYTTGFFRSMVESGAHQRSLSLITSGEVDGSAIDSTVLETELRRTPSLHREVKVVATLGPSPIPPLVVSRALPSALRDDLRHAVLQIHRDRRGSQVLWTGRVHRYVQVQDLDYDPIRMMAASGAAVSL
jgi:phosphonate transport system substrate-binding protein